MKREDFLKLTKGAQEKLEKAVQSVSDTPATPPQGSKALPEPSALKKITKQICAALDDAIANHTESKRIVHRGS